MRLHLGCGPKHWPGYVNIDLPGTDPKPDVECDIRLLPYKQGTIEEIVSIHSLEHLHRHEAVQALSHWTSLLRRGGSLVVELPCLERILRNFRTLPTQQMTTWGLYGEQRLVEAGHVAMQHKWCWGMYELMKEFRRCGLVEVLSEPVQFHQPVRDMRIVGIKP